MGCVNLLAIQASEMVKGCHWCKHFGCHSLGSHSELNAAGGDFADYIADGKNGLSLVAGTGILGRPSNVTGRSPVTESLADLQDWFVRCEYGRGKGGEGCLVVDSLCI